LVARFNSCGHPTEIGHEAYVTRARLYPDSEEEFEIRWYPTRDDVPFLRGPHAINSLGWERDREEWWPLTVGEVWGTAAGFGVPPVPLTAIGGHTCGTAADFAGDGRIDLEPPYVEYRPDGLPFCCGAIFESVGGLGLSGVADVTWRGPHVGSGGLVVGGTATAYYVEPSAGGVVLGGSAEVQWSPELVGSGGVVLGGSAEVQWSPAITGTGGVQLGGEASVFSSPGSTGGLQLGGEASVQWSAEIVGTGGVALGGVATIYAGVYVEGSGGVALGGVATIYAGVYVEGTGGVQLGGSADVWEGEYVEGTGGVQLGGSADVSWTPPAPTPGSSCATAGVFSISTTHGATISGFGTQHWWKISGLTNGASYHVTTTNVGGMSGASMNGYSGPNCSSLSAVGWIIGVPDCHGFTADSNGNLWVQFFPPLMGSAAYTFRVDPGTC